MDTSEARAAALTTHMEYFRETPHRCNAKKGLAHWAAFNTGGKKNKTLGTLDSDSLTSVFMLLLILP